MHACMNCTVLLFTVADFTFQLMKCFFINLLKNCFLFSDCSSGLALSGDPRSRQWWECLQVLSPAPFNIHTMYASLFSGWWRVKHSFPLPLSTCVYVYPRVYLYPHVYIMYVTVVHAFVLILNIIHVYSFWPSVITCERWILWSC